MSDLRGCDKVTDASLLSLQLRACYSQLFTFASKVADKLSLVDTKDTDDGFESEEETLLLINSD